MIYLDNSATTRPFDAVIDAMAACMREEYFNPSSLYAPAMKAEKLMAQARDEISKALGGDVRVIFTSGGTEADNIALLGAARNLRGRKGHFIITKVEHPAILETAAELERLGHDVTYIGVDANGVVDVDVLVDAVREDTVLVSVMQVNNEVGAIMPLEEISRRVKEKNPKTLIHSDGVQGFMRCPLNMKKAGVDLYSLSAHKIHGPKGIGALVLAKNARVLNINFGGGQEGGLRNGTENVPGIVGLGQAVRSYKQLGDTQAAMLPLKQRLAQKIKEAIPDAKVNGDIETGAAHILNVTFPVKGEVLLHAIEGAGVMCSTGSACASHKKSASHVLTAMGVSNLEIDGALRFSLCPMNTLEEMDETAKQIAKNVDMLRRFKRR